MKKILAVLCACVMLLGLVGCGGKKVVEDGVVVVDNGDGGIYAETASSPQTLKIGFTEAGLGRDWLIEISKKFVKQNPEYKVVLDGDPSLADSLQTKLETSKNLSDIFFPLNSAWETYAARGWLEPLDDIYNAAPQGEQGKTVAEKMDESYREYSNLSTKDGKHYYIMPWNDTVTGIVYNVKMFEQYGWQIPETTDELETLCKKIIADTSGKVKPFAYPGKIGGYFDYIGTTWWMQSSGIEGLKTFFEFGSQNVYDAYVQPAKGKWEALTEFSRFFAIDKGYGVDGSMSKDHTTSQMDFCNGKAAMIVNANWMENEMLTSMPDGFTMGMMSIPYLATARKDGENYIRYNYTTAPDYIIIPKAAGNKEGAKKFLSFMSRDDMLMLYTAECGSPRPFDYNPLEIEGLSKFTRDCLALRNGSQRMLEYSRSPLYQNGYTQKYIGGQPYSLLVRKETDATRFCNVEFDEADSKWATWVSSSNL